MTDRLHDLLVQEADGLDVPAPRSDDVLSRGRAVRRRRRLVSGAAALATAAVVAGAASLALGGDGGSTQVASEPGSQPAFTVGTTLHFGDDQTATIDDKAVKSIFYTSAGVLVRHGNNSWSDGGGPQRFSLVSTDGSVHPLGLVTEETVHATDPDEPYVVYGENVDGELQLVAYDVTADKEAARVDVAATSEGWFPVALDGGTAYVQDGYDGHVYAVDLQTGEVTKADLPTVWEIAGGRAAEGSSGDLRVVDLATGKDVLDIDGKGYLDLSPDGRYVMLVSQDMGTGKTPATTEVYDVATGDHVTVEGDGFSWGWTADGALFRVDDGRLTTCDSGTGECAVTDLDLPTAGPQEAPVCPAREGKQGGVSCEDPPDPAEVRLGGRTYES